MIAIPRLRHVVALGAIAASGAFVNDFTIYRGLQYVHEARAGIRHSLMDYESRTTVIAPFPPIPYSSFIPQRLLDDQTRLGQQEVYLLGRSLILKYFMNRQPRCHVKQEPDSTENNWI